MAWHDALNCVVWNNVFSGVGGALLGSGLGAWWGNRHARKLALRAERLLVAERLHAALSDELAHVVVRHDLADDRDLDALIALQPGWLRRRRVRQAVQAYRQLRQDEVRVDMHGQRLRMTPTPARSVIAQLLRYTKHE